MKKVLLVFIGLVFSQVVIAQKPKDIGKGTPFGGENPYNYVGEQHNKLLASFLERYGSKCKSMTPAERQDLIIKVISSEPVLNGEYLSDKFMGKFLEPTKKGLDLLTAIKEADLMGTGSINKIELSYYTNFKNSFDKISPSNKENYAKLKTLILNSENEILSNSKKFNNSVFLLTTLAVAKYSLDFHTKNGSNPTPLASVAKDDLEGAAAGGTLGAVLGGGIGGACIGAVGGAVIASAMAAVNPMGNNQIVR